MTLRQHLGGDARRIYELVETLLDGEDSLIVLIDARRAVSFAQGFGLSPCQLELVTTEIERAVRAVGGTERINPVLPLAGKAARRILAEREERPDSGKVA